MLPDRYRWDYIEALLICRKADGPATTDAPKVGPLTWPVSAKSPSKPLDLTRLNG